MRKLKFSKNQTVAILAERDAVFITLRFIKPGKPNGNAFIERALKKYRHEILDAHLFHTLAEVKTSPDE